MKTDRTDKTVLNEDMENIIINELVNSGVQKNSPILFIAEGMCSDCITKEFINLKNDSILLNSIIVVGLFSKQRYFTSSIGNLMNVRNIYINSNYVDSKDKKNDYLFYSIYDEKSSKLTQLFYPDPCDVSLTIDYFRVVKEKCVP
ncbi:hypothetical protein [Proteiniphilum saccharofermentans]|uniref:hypothetical protein n=1 Tax=Proteiniphilum saccharofermentans TaxID=1642647 RepID=UPI0028A6FC6C|nr:hypothetical protein [Proteiniphilum saccharofermentans]